MTHTNSLKRIGGRVAGRSFTSALLLLTIGVFYTASTSFRFAVEKSAPDFVLSKNCEFELKEQGNSLLSARAKVAMEITFLTEHASEMDKFFVYESFFTPISDIQGRLNSSKLSDGDLFSWKAESEDVFLTEDKIYSLRVPETIAPGDHFSFKYSQKFEDVAFIPVIDIPNVDSLQEFRISVRHPEEYHISFEFSFPADSFPCQIEHPDEEETVLKCGPFRGLNRLAYFPYNASRAFVLLKIARGPREVYPKTPADFLEWYQKKTLLTPRLDSEHGTLLAGTIDSSAPAEDKLRVIDEYIRSTMRYIADERGSNAIVPRDPGVVADLKYGDCKDRAFLACAIARRYGVEVSMALVSTETGPEFQGVALDFFNHMICAYVVDGQTRFFDPTAKYCEFGNIPEGILGARALVLDPRAPRWERITVPQRKSSIELGIQVSLDSLESGNARITLRNDAASSARYARQELAAGKLDRACQDIIASTLDQLRISHFRFVSDSGDSVVLDADADCSRFIIRSGVKTYIPRVPFLTNGTELLERDRDPWAMYFAGGMAMKFTLRLSDAPRGVEGEPLSMGTLSGEIAFSSAIDRSDQGPVVVYEYRRAPKYIGGESKTGYMSFLKDFLQQRKTLFTISQN